MIHQHHHEQVQRQEIMNQEPKASLMLTPRSASQEDSPEKPSAQPSSHVCTIDMTGCVTQVLDDHATTRSSNASHVATKDSTAGMPLGKAQVPQEEEEEEHHHPISTTKTEGGDGLASLQDFDLMVDEEYEIRLPSTPESPVAVTTKKKKKQVHPSSSSSEINEQTTGATTEKKQKYLTLGRGLRRTFSSGDGGGVRRTKSGPTDTLRSMAQFVDSKGSVNTLSPSSLVPVRPSSLYI